MPNSPGTKSQAAERSGAIALWRGVLVVAILGTMGLGVYLRWVLAERLSLSLPFGYFRHAHSHLGYFGLLFPLAWLGWKQAGVELISRRALILYAGFTVLASIGFIRAGYGPIAIAGCTAVSGFWLWSLRPLLTRIKRMQDPLGAVPFGVVLSLACVPPIAIFLRKDPQLAQGFVSTFLSGLLLMVVIPSCLAGSRARVGPGPWPLLLVSGVLGSAYLGVMPHWSCGLGLLVYAGLLGVGSRSAQVPTHVRMAWWVVAAGLTAMALGLVPNVRPVALGAIHFLVLGPVLSSLAPLWLPKDPPAWAWYLGHAGWGTMSMALVAQAFGGDARTWLIAAVGGTATLLWWLVVLAWQLQPSPRRADS